MRTLIRPLLLSGMALAAAVALSPVCSAQPDQGATGASDTHVATVVKGAVTGVTKLASGAAKNSPRVSALRGLSNATQTDPTNGYVALSGVQSQMTQMNLQNQLLLTTLWAPPVVFAFG